MPKTNNYFRVVIMNGKPHYIFFSDGDTQSMADAWARVLSKVSEAPPAQNSFRVGVWKAPTIPGPWDSVQIMGYRSRRDLESDPAAASELRDLETMIAERRYEKSTAA